jgi:hypothetical protein
MRGILVSGSTSKSLRMSSSFPVNVAVPSISNLTMAGLAVTSKPKPTMIVWLFRSFSSSFALTLKLTASAPPLKSSLDPNRLAISTFTETLGTCKDGQIVDSPHQQAVTMKLAI